MAYATYQNIETRLDTDGVTFSPASHKVTQTECEAIIDEIGAEINAILKAQGYATVPVTGANDLLMLRRYVANKTAAEVWMIIFSSTTLPDYVKAWLDDYVAFLNRLRQGQQFLIDQDPTSTQAGQILIGGMTLRGSQWTQSDVETYESDFDLP